MISGKRIVQFVDFVRQENLDVVFMLNCMFETDETFLNTRKAFSRYIGLNRPISIAQFIHYCDTLRFIERNYYNVQS